MKKLTALRRDGRVRAGLPDSPTEWFRVGPIRNEVVGEQGDGQPETRTAADVYVYESIGGWFGMTADDFVRDVAGLDVEHINLHLNSPGGDAFEGVAMANVLRQHKAEVTVWVDGLAASAASVVAMAGDTIVMGVGAQLMVHDASSYGLGSAADLRKEAEVLDSVSDSIAATYAARAGGTTAEWRAVMIGEAWYGGEEAVAARLADRVAGDADKGTAGGEQIVPGQSAGALWDWWDSASSADRHTATVRTLYAHAGRETAPPPPMPGRPATKTPAATASGSTTHERSRPVAFSDEQLSKMRQELGLAEDADEATIVDALSEALTERAEDEPQNRTTTAPAGTRIVEDGVLEQLRADAAAGRQARQQQLADERARTVTAAVRDGRIPRARAEHWTAALAADPEGAGQQLASLAPGLIPVDERGHDQAGAAEAPEQPATLQAVRASDAYLNWRF